MLESSMFITQNALVFYQVATVYHEEHNDIFISLHFSRKLLADSIATHCKN